MTLSIKKRPPLRPLPVAQLLAEWERLCADESLPERFELSEHGEIDLFW